MITNFYKTMRMGIVLACYGLSLLGFAMMFQLMREELNKPNGSMVSSRCHVVCVGDR
jgi:hypothetical protein